MMLRSMSEIYNYDTKSRLCDDKTKLGLYDHCIIIVFLFRHESC